MTRIIFVIAPEKFRDEELFHTQEELEKKGIMTVIASTKKGACKGKLGGTGVSTLLLDEIQTDHFDGICFIGGPGAQIFFNDPKAHALARNFFSAQKITAAICAAPGILARAGILNGKKATCFEDQREILRLNGALLVDADVVEDNWIITANGPKAAREFGKTIARKLGRL